MISLELYRARIGTFNTIRVNTKARSLRDKLEISLSVKFALLNLFAFVLLAILIAGDVESNPGPVNVTKSVQGSFHQGDERFKNDSVGSQCVCNAAFAICYSVFKPVTYWSTFDLDYILIHGDELYKKLGHESEFLYLNDLPSSIMIENTQVNLRMLANETPVLPALGNFSFLQETYEKNKGAEGNGMILIIRAYGFAILRVNVNNIYLFDSHSRDENGILVGSGTSVLLKFSNFQDVDQFIYERYAGICPYQFEIQYVSVTFNAIARLRVIDSLNKQRKSYNRGKRKISSSEHQNETELKKRHSTNSNLEKSQYYSLNVDKVRQQQKEYYLRNADRVKQCTKTYYVKNIDKIKETKSKYYASNAEKIKELQSKYYASNAEKIRQNKNEYYLLNFETVKAKRRSYVQQHSKLINKKKRESRKMIDAKRQYISEKNIKQFKDLISHGPYFVCVVCNRTMYKRSIQIFNEEKYTIAAVDIFSYRVKSFDDLEYICKTCHSKLIKGKVPCQAVCNDLFLYDFPSDYPLLRKLEKVLISKRLLFKKITIMPKGQSPKIKGAICNVPIETDEICNILPRGMDNNGVVQVTLKKRLQFKSHVYLEPVRPDVIQTVLLYLKANNPLYSDIEVNMQIIPPSLLNLNLQNNTNQVDNNREHMTTTNNNNEEMSADNTEYSDNKNSAVEETENPLDEHRLGSFETTFVPSIPFHEINEENVVIAPGENKQPLSIVSDKNCEELAHPYLFPTGKYGYTCKRDVDLSPAKYFNQRLLNYTQKFASDTDYIFYAQAVMQHLNLNSHINIALKKVKGDNITAGMLTQNFREKVKDFIANDEAFNFMNTMKGTPAYWKRFLFEVLAMVKQLGLPTFFMTLSCADLRWNELVDIILKLNKQNIPMDDIQSMNYFDRTKILNSNPVLMARHFQFRVETFFKEIVVDGTLGKAKYYAIRVEFQVRGSPHIHSLLWIENAPTLSIDNIDEYVSFVDSIVKCELPDRLSYPKLFDLVRTYQIHSHSKSCRKYKNIACRYNFGKFFTDRTIIASPLPETIDDNDKKNILSARNLILQKVKNYIDTFLDPKKINFLDTERPDYQSVSTIKEILCELNIPEEEYYTALSMSSDSSFQIHFKRNPDSCFVNHYFTDGLVAWEANIDIQPVLDYYRAVSYMCAYLSKSEDESTEAMKCAAAEAVNTGQSLFEKMKSIAKAYRTHREMSIQEAVSIVMPEIWLRKTSPVVMFANSNLPEKRYRICRSEEEISGLPQDSTDLFKRNMLDRYVDRPNTLFRKGKYSLMDSVCFAEFLSYYYVKSKPNPNEENDCQPEILEEIQLAETSNLQLPKTLPLMTLKETMQLRKEKCVLRYHVPSKMKNPEGYAHHMLMMFFPFRKESELKSQQSNTYTEKLFEKDVLETVNRNKAVCEPFGDLVEEAFVDFHANVRNIDPCGEQENSDVLDELRNVPTTEHEEYDEDNVTSSSTQTVSIISDDEMRAKYRSLNNEQRSIFETINAWCRNHLKHLSLGKKVEPIRVFLTGSAGCGKSYLLSVLSQSLTKSLSYHSNTYEKPRVLVIAPTGVAAVNINGGTIHASLGIPADHMHGKCLPKLSDKRRCMLRNKFSELTVIIIDEISMVSNRLLLSIHQRLLEIFGCTNEEPFAGISVIACGDFYQLPPIQAKAIYMPYNDPLLNLSHCWKYFYIAELTKIMRQRGDQRLIDLLNHIRIGKIDEEDEVLLKSRLIEKNNSAYPVNAIHIWAENNPVNDHNDLMLQSLTNTMWEIIAIDILPKNVPQSKINQVYSRSQMNTGGLAHKLQLKRDAKVMITCNLDVEDKLNNGQIGTVYDVKLSDSGDISIIYLKMEDEKAGLKVMNTDRYAAQNKVVPIKKVEKEIKITKHSFSSPVIKRLQFPLVLSWACTVHKVQGKTFDKVVVNMELQKQRYFHSGQMYVALSRVTNIEGLYLTGTFNRNSIKVDTKATEQYEKMRNECPLKSIADVGTLNDECIIITLLNARSLIKHAIDVASDEILLQSDLIGFTETHVVNENSLGFEEMKQTLNNFTIVSNINENDRFSSLAFAYKNKICYKDHYNVPNAALMTFSKPPIFDQPITIVLLYRKKSLSKKDFSYLLQHLISRENNINIIMGDFNIDASGNNNYVRDILQGYEQIVKEPTHISGSLLDHVYIKKSWCQHVDVNCLVKNLYFSDHDAIRFLVKHKSL